MGFWATEVPLSGATAAEWYAGTRGWLVCPGTHVTGATCSCGWPECHAPGAHPAEPGWWHQSTTDVARVRSWWRRQPDSSIVLPTGLLFDVLDVPARAGAQALNWWEALEYRIGPVAHTARGRMLFWVSPDSGLPAVLADAHDAAPDDRPDGRDHGRDDWESWLDIRCHSIGGYVVAPPCAGSTWLHPPNRRWHLPAAADLFGTLVHGCQHQHRGPLVTVPPQRTGDDLEQRDPG
jgi:hypothetical protein